MVVGGVAEAVVVPFVITSWFKTCASIRELRSVLATTT